MFFQVFFHIPRMDLGMDIDDVVLTLDPTTTTTPKSAARGHDNRMSLTHP